MKPYTYALLAAAAACGLASAAETAYTTPVGYVSQECKANSDTIVGLPVRISAAGAGALSAAPDTTTIPGSAILTLAGTPGFADNAFANTHYVKFKNVPATAATGQWFVVTANTANSLTVNLNGATITASLGDSLEVIKFWTLNELFNPAASTTDPLTTGNAIVASTSTLVSGRRTQVLIPNLTAQGTNLAPATTYFVHSGVWKKPGQADTNYGLDQLWPDTYFIIRNPASVTSATTYTAVGEVEANDIDVSLATRAAGQQDNFIGLPRPVDTSLNALNLGGTSAFMSSTSTLVSGRRDQLLLFNNAAVGQNKAPATTYFFHNGLWKKPGSGDTDFGSDVIPAGAGFIIRKYQTGTGQTDEWNNDPAY